MPYISETDLPINQKLTIQKKLPSQEVNILINHIAQRPLASIKTLNVGGNYLRFPWQGFC